MSTKETFLLQKKTKVAKGDTSIKEKTINNNHYWTLLMDKED